MTASLSARAPSTSRVCRSPADKESNADNFDSPTWADMPSRAATKKTSSPRIITRWHQNNLLLFYSYRRLGFTWKKHRVRTKYKGLRLTTVPLPCEQFLSC